MRKREFMKCIDKNRHYWSKGFHEDGINNYLRSKLVGDVGCLSGEWDKTKFNVFVFKEPYYIIIMVLTFSGLTVSEGNKDKIRMVNREIVKFNYTEVVSDN